MWFIIADISVSIYKNKKVESERHRTAVDKDSQKILRTFFDNLGQKMMADGI